MTVYANLRSEAAGFVTDWKMTFRPAASDLSRVAELDRGARIIEAQMHEIDRLTAEVRLFRCGPQTVTASTQTTWAELGVMDGDGLGIDGEAL